MFFRFLLLLLSLSPVLRRLVLRGYLLTRLRLGLALRMRRRRSRLRLLRRALLLRLMLLGLLLRSLLLLGLLLSLLLPLLLRLLRRARWWLLRSGIGRLLLLGLLLADLRRTRLGGRRRDRALRRQRLCIGCSRIVALRPPCTRVVLSLP